MISAKICAIVCCSFMLPSCTACLPKFASLSLATAISLVVLELCCMPLLMLNATAMRCGCHNKLLTIFFLLFVCVFVNYYACANRLWNLQLYLQTNKQGLRVLHLRFHVSISSRIYLYMYVCMYLYVCIYMFVINAVK